MPFKKGVYDPNRFDLSKWRAEKAARAAAAQPSEPPSTVSRNPSTAGVPIVRMDADALAKLDRLKNPPQDNPFASTGGWGGTKGEVWGTFKSVSQPTNEWDNKPKVEIKPSDPW